MKLLAIGDVYGAAGLRAVQRWLPRLREETAAGLVVVNVENLHGGRGADPEGVREVFDCGADCLTSGNHIWGHRTHARLLEDEPRLLRPANYPAPCPGRGAGVFSAAGGVRIAVINLQGRVFMQPVDDPFRCAAQLLEDLRGEYDVCIVDMHAEASSEKLALAMHLDGKIAALFGTHTHVQTADARILPSGTGYITDLGMTGPYDSIIVMEPDHALRRFRTGRPVRPAPATGDLGLRRAVFDIDAASGCCLDVVRIARGKGGT